MADKGNKGDHSVYDAVGEDVDHDDGVDEVFDVDEFDFDDAGVAVDNDEDMANCELMKSFGVV